jgi:hypothetical protein
MDRENDTRMDADLRDSRGFFASLFHGLIRDAFKLFVSFGIGTGAGALVCWYYGLPLALSLLGGILVLGLALALMSDSLFS